MVVVFPAGAVSTAPDKLGRKPAVDARWQPFVVAAHPALEGRRRADLVRRAEQPPLPDRQPPQLHAAHLADLPRGQVAHRDVALAVAIGAPIPFASLAAIKDRQALADELRGRVYALARLAPAAR